MNISKKDKSTLDWKIRLRILRSGLSEKLNSRGTLRINQVIKISRYTTVLPIFEGLEVEVHNGQRHVRIKVTKDMVGHRFGEFVATSSWALNSGTTQVSANVKTSVSKGVTKR